MPPSLHRNRKPTPRARSLIVVSQARGSWGEVQLATLGACEALPAAADPRLAEGQSAEFKRKAELAKMGRTQNRSPTAELRRPFGWGNEWEDVFVQFVY